MSGQEAPLARNPISEEPQGITMDQLIAREGNNLFDKLDDPSPEDRGADVRQFPQPPRQQEQEQESPPEEQEEEDSSSLEDILSDMGVLDKKQRTSGEDAGDEDGEEQSDTGISVDLQRLADTLGVDTAYLVRDEGTGSLRIRTKVDGVVEDKSLPEILKGYQLQQHNTRQGMELARQREEWEKQRTEQAQQLQQHLQLADALATQEQQAIEARYSQIDWDALRARDAAQYSALVMDYQREMADAQRRREQTQQMLTQQQEQQQREQIERLKTYRDQERQRFLEASGWSGETAKENAQQLVSYLTGPKGGFRPEEVAQLYDHRVALLAHKAKLWDDLKERVQTKQRKAAPSPHKEVRGTTPSSTQGVRQGRRAAARRASQALQKSGSIEDFAALAQADPKRFGLG